MLRLLYRLFYSVAFILGFSFHSLASSPLLPFVNGGDKVLADDPIAKSTVMLETDKQYCSATIISDNMLLTAAHCIGENEPWVLIHFSGLESALTRSASRSLRHEGYQDLQDTTRNDIALVFFEGGLPEGFLPMMILPADKDLAVGDELQIAGYGAGGPLGSLAKVSLKVSDFLDTRRLIKFAQTTHRGICHGDSGGPAFKVLNNQLYLAGVASYANEIDCSDYSVYTRATNYIDWILQKQKE
ncbi:MAG TPA: trypsin-like serine protease [Pseudobdellovibrionaceae bacterium]|jgi:V8-like Glu-specific endopeptidase